MISLSEAKRLVIKVGSSLVTEQGERLDSDAIASWAQQIAELISNGKEIVLVSSGAIACGMQRLAWKKRPHAIHELQAAAAVGQMGLVETYENHFKKYKLLTAQVLLTNEDLTDRKRYLNARSTLKTLLDLKVIPVINENDTVTTDEIKFGDNDTLAALVANLVEADLLIILTDQSGLYDADPRKQPSATLIQEATAGDTRLEAVAGEAGSSLAKGGMLTKVLAAKRAALSGAHTVIASGHEPNVLPRIIANERIGTRLVTQMMTLAARKQWLANQFRAGGKLTLDPGAVRALCNEGKSLLPIGVVAASGEFDRGEVVTCFNAEGQEIARGLINYNAQETRRILRHSSKDIEAILGYVIEPELIHRDNLVLL